MVETVEKGQRAEPALRPMTVPAGVQATARAAPSEARPTAAAAHFVVAVPGRGLARRLRRLARSYLSLTSHTCSAVGGYGLAVLLGFTPLSGLWQAIELIRAHLGLAAGLVGLGVGLALGAGFLLARRRSRQANGQAKRRAPRSGFGRGARTMLRAAVGSLVTTMGLRYLCGLAVLPSGSPLAQVLAQLASWVAALLALGSLLRLLRPT